MDKYQFNFGAFKQDQAGQRAINVLRKKGLFTLSLPHSLQPLPDNIILVMFISSQQRLRKGKLLCCSAHTNHIFLRQKRLPTPFVVVCDPEAEGEEFEKAVTDIAKNYLFWLGSGFSFHNTNHAFPPWGSRPNDAEKIRIFEAWVKRARQYLAGYLEDYREYCLKPYERKVDTVRL